MQVREVDLKNENQESLKDKFSQCDVIYVNGGNTFYLLEWVRRSGFDKIISSFLNQGKIFVGVSAGSYIACPTIEMATWKHGDKNVVGLKDLRALNLVPFLIVAHFEEEHYLSIKNVAKKIKYPIITLNDKQAVLVEGKKVKVVGKGKKIFFNNFIET